MMKHHQIDMATLNLLHQVQEVSRPIFFGKESGHSAIEAGPRLDLHHGRPQMVTQLMTKREYSHTLQLRWARLLIRAMDNRLIHKVTPMTADGSPDH